MIKKIIAIIANVLLVTTTLIICAWIIYCKINNKDITIELTANTIQEYYPNFLSFFISSLLILITITISIILSWKMKENKSTRFSKIFMPVAVWLAKYNIFYRTYGIIFNFIGHNKLKALINFAATILDYSTSKNRNIILIFTTLPRLIIVIIFVFELCITKQLHYYFFSLILLLIPLLFRIFLFILKDLPDRVLPEFKKLLDIKKDTVTLPAGTPLTPNGPKEFMTIKYEFKAEYLTGNPKEDDEYLARFLHNYYYPLMYLGGHMQVFVLPLYYKIRQTTVLVYFGVHVCGWGYIIFYLM